MAVQFSNYSPGVRQIVISGHSSDSSIVKGAQVLNSAENDAASPATLRITVRIKNKLGLHLRPASQLVKIASQYDDCDIQICKDGQQINAKSIMGVIMLAAEQGSELLIEATGESAAEVLSNLEQLIESGFGEE